MKIPVSWLREYVELPESLADLVQRLTISGLEVASVRFFGLPTPADLKVKQEEVGPVWDKDKVLTALVLSIAKHPNADKLKLVELDLGNGQVKTVVTGAPNIAVGESGMKVVVGLRGTNYFYEVEDKATKQKKKQFFTLEPKDLRGIPNDAMVMSSFELGINDEHEGIILLEPEAPVGAPAADYMGDVVLEVDILPNMARCLSMLGVAREVAAITGVSAKISAPTIAATSESVEGKFKIEIEDPSKCGRYTGALLGNVVIKPAPGWMQRRLEYSGMRPISNVVDITNYVMLEIGQPLHAFDYDVLMQRSGGKPPVISVRQAKPGEKLTTLDQQVRELVPEDLIIADTLGPIALAGVMGGLDTEVTSTTRTILLESANFDPVSIRKTARRYNLFSEASTRFTKAIHTEQAKPTSLRACELFQKHADATIYAGLIDVYPLATETKIIDLKRTEIVRLLGISIDDREVERILTALNFEVKSTEFGWKVTAPPFRTDIQVGSADLIEELGRIYGYDRIQGTTLSGALPQQSNQDSFTNEERIRDILALSGLQEAITYSLTSKTVEADFTSVSAHVEIINAISPERNVMRTTLIPHLLEVALLNRERAKSIRLFEAGAVYLSTESSKLPQEPQRLSLLLHGDRDSESWQQSGKTSETLGFYDLKGIIENLTRQLHLPDVKFTPCIDSKWLHPGRSATLLSGEEVIGVFGELHPRLVMRRKLEGKPIVLGELNLESILTLIPGRFAYQPASNFPEGKRDLAIIVEEGISHHQIEVEMNAAAGDVVRKIELFDVYRGDPVPAGSKSLAYAITYQAIDRTLTDKEIDQAHKKIEGRLRHMLKASVRGKD
jgi:phenylalanyl-tRNA synthetase beta chain